MAYGAEYIYQGMANAIPNGVATYDAVSADKRRRQEKDDDLMRQIQLMNADTNAQEQAGNQVLYAGVGQQPAQSGGANALPQVQSSPSASPVPPEVAAKNDPKLRRLGAGGLGAPTYGDTTADAPKEGQAYQKPIGPKPALDMSNPEEALRSTLLDYHKLRADRKQSRLQHADKLDIAQEYTGLLKQQNYTEKSAQMAQTAVKAAQSGKPEMLQMLVGTKYDLNDPAQMSQAIEDQMADIAQMVSDNKVYQQERQMLEQKRMELGVPAFTNDFEAAQWMRSQKEGAPTTGSSQNFTPGVQRQGQIRGATGRSGNR